MPIQTLPPSWQVLQPLVMPEWICAVVGAGVANSEPGTVRVALAGISPVTLARVPRWQASQVVLDGMCEDAPIGLVGGRPMILVMPAKVAVDARWQVAGHAVVGDAGVAHARAGELGAVGHRQRGHARARADVAQLAGRAGRDVVARQADDARSWPPESRSWPPPRRGIARSCWSCSARWRGCWPAWASPRSRGWCGRRCTAPSPSTGCGWPACPARRRSWCRCGTGCSRPSPGARRRRR